MKAAALALALALAFLLGSGTAWAIPAYPGAVEVAQPDGATITIRLRGDEWLHWHEDAKGFAIVLERGEWKYATLGVDGRLAPTPHPVGRSNPRAVGLAPGIRPTLDGETRRRLRTMHEIPAGGERMAAAPTGIVKNLVLLCNFNDHTVLTHGSPVTAFDSLFNLVNSTGRNAPTGSVRDYFLQASYGALTMASTVKAWVTLPNSEAYYGNGQYGLPGAAAPYPTNAAGMVHDVLDQVDPIVNFADFDQDNDGFVDAITIVHSGYGGEYPGNGTNAIWSHRYSLGASFGGGAWTSADNNANGVKVKVDPYHTEAARYGPNTGTAFLRIGVVAHELGHFFGLPDLNDSGEPSNGLGNWCVMGNPWGWDQSQLYPPLPSAWVKIQLGWVNPLVSFSPGIYSVAQAATNPEAVTIGQGLPAGEYFLVENRQAVGFDVQIPNPGLAIYHIDEAASDATEGFPGQPGWPENGNHYRVALVQADNSYDLERGLNQGDFFDLYRSSPGTVLSESTSPNSNSYKGGVVKPSGVVLSNVSAPGFIMTFHFMPSVWVDFNDPGPIHNGTLDDPFTTLVAGVAAVQTGGRVVCKAGTSTETPTITKAVSITSYQGAATIGQ